MRQLIRKSLHGTALAVVLGMTAVGTTGFAQAENSLDDVQVQGTFDTAAPTKYLGTVDRIPSGSRTLIIDDTLLTIDNVVLVNGQSWSRERLAGYLEEGMQVSFELKQGPSGRFPLIISINVR
ncbi:hypothetical protein [Marinobacter apostichopi]|uniref:hypothetical protein n=1 Tax=Marinobacter apostichopi TaxID=3035454 RepID=UPI0025744089|nr:hypothetical protein [Marinobacter sp. LA51]